MEVTFFFSNINNTKNNVFVNNLLDKLKIEKINKVNVDKRKLKINTPALKVNNNNKLLYNKDCLTFIAKLEKSKQNNIINKPQPQQDISTPNTYDTLEMNNFSDSYSFIGDNNPLQSTYEYISNNNNAPPQPNNLNTVQSNNLSISNEKKKFNQRSYEDYIQQRSNDPYIKK